VTYPDGAQHHPDIWDLLPDRRPPQIEVPEWPQFMRARIHYRQSLDDRGPQSAAGPQEIQ
jgi:hypothetical protein